MSEGYSFPEAFARCRRGVRAVVDLPDRRLHIICRALLTGGGRLDAEMRAQSPELTDMEIRRMEMAAGHVVRKMARPTN